METLLKAFESCDKAGKTSDRPFPQIEASSPSDKGAPQKCQGRTYEKGRLRVVLEACFSVAPQTERVIVQIRTPAPSLRILYCSYVARCLEWRV